MDKKIIVWFRFDLRLADNPSLHAAVHAGKIIPIYILDEFDAGDFKMGSSSRWWLHQSLQALSDSLDGALLFYKGHALTVLEQIIEEHQATGVYWNRCYEPWAIARDTKIKATLLERGLDAQSFNGSLLWEPHEVVKNDGTPYKVFTAFFNNGCMTAKTPREPLPAPKLNLNNHKHTTSVDQLGLKIDPVHAANLATYWTPGEKNSMKRLKYFVENNLSDYKIGRDFPAKESVSRLSPHLRFGEISPNQVWSMIQNVGYDFATRENVQHFLKELGWREFAYNVLFYNPTVARENLQKKFDNFGWRDNQSDLKAWQSGMTGYPIVDAAMRELAQTGYMHNRMRMVVGSFLIKNLMIHWHKGEEWFWDLLVDADFASNSFSWQWVAGCGYDAAPYFRIFNPITQGEKFDPNGIYTRSWVPEVAALPDAYLFEPWKAPESVLRQAKIVLGKTYPKPIVDLGESRNRALAEFKKL